MTERSTRSEQNVCTTGGGGGVIYPAMDLHLVQGGVAVVLVIPDVKETGISSGRLGLWLVYAFSLPLKYIKGYGREICHFGLKT